MVDFAKSQWNEMYSNIRIFRWPGVEKPRKAGRDSEGTLIRWLVRRKERARAKAKPSPVFQQVAECWNCGQYGHRSFECPSRYTKDAKAMGRTSTRIGKSKPLGRAGQMGESWVEPTAVLLKCGDFVLQPCSSPAAPAAEASPSGGSVPEPTGPPLPRIISKEYTEINGQAHTKRT